MSAGFNAGLTAWRSGGFPLYDNTYWDDYATRLNRYRSLEYYYSNQQYNEVNAAVRELKKQGKLYINTRSIYNPVTRLVNLYADKIYPATLNLETLASGAIPIDGSPEQIEAIKQLFKWSNWNAKKQVYVRKGETLGDVFLRVVDDVNSRRVIIEVLVPQKVKYLRTDAAGNIKEIWITYIERKDDKPSLDNTIGTTNNETYTVTEVITGEAVTIYHDGKRVDGWDNPFGFVPVVQTKVVDENKQFGSVRWNISRSKVDESNSLASVLNDAARKSLTPILAAIGATLSADTLKASVAAMDEVLLVNIPNVQGDLKSVPINVDISSTLNSLQAQLEEIEKDNPELFLYKLTDMTVSPSGVAMRQFFDLAVNRIEGAQGTYDDPLRRVIQMAMTIGGVQKYKNFESFNLQSYEQGDLEFQIKPRPVIYDELTKEQSINALIASGAPASSVWDVLDVGLDKQDQWKAEKEADAKKALDNAQALQPVASVGGAQNTPNLENQ